MDRVGVLFDRLREELGHAQAPAPAPAAPDLQKLTAELDPLRQFAVAELDMHAADVLLLELLDLGRLERELNRHAPAVCREAIDHLHALAG